MTTKKNGFEKLQAKAADLAIQCTNCARNAGIDGKARKMFEKYAIKLYSQLRSLRTGDYDWAIPSIIETVLVEVEQAIGACKGVTENTGAALAIVEVNESIDALDSLIQTQTPTNI